jgi:hypothetical protein
MTKDAKEKADSDPRKIVLALLMACVSPPNHATSARVAHYAARVRDWDSCLSALRHHRLASQAYAHAQTKAFEGYPETVIKALTALHGANVDRLESMRNALHEAVVGLGAQNIPSICLRGPALAELLYEQATARHFDDFDIIVPRSEMEQARSVLSSLGYYSINELSRALEDRVVSGGESLQLKKPNSDFVLHLNWRVASRHFQYEPIDWNEEVIAMTLEGEGVRTLSAEDYALLLCAFGTQNEWSKLCWVADVAVLMQRPGVDWERVKSLAERSGGVRMLLTAVVLTHLVCDSAIPPALQALVDRDRKSWVLAKRIADQHTANMEFVSRDDFGSQLFQLRSRERMRDRIRYGIRGLLLPSGRDYRALELPSAFYVLYFLFRPIRLISKSLCKA